MESFQEVQDIYNRITQNSEKLHGFIHELHQIDSDDIERLHTEIERGIEPFNCISSQLSIVVKFASGKTETYSSFPRFQLHMGSYPDPTVELDMRYRFILVLPNSDGPREYKLDIGLRSHLGLQDALDRKKASKEERFMYRKLDNATGKIIIEFVDYSTAKSIYGVVEDWYRGVSKTDSSRTFDIAKAAADLAPTSFCIGAALATMFTANWFFSDQIADLSTLYTTLLITACGLFLIPTLSFLLGKFIENEVNSLSPMSTICIGKGDNNAIEKNLQCNRRRLRSSIAGGITVVALNLVSSALFYYWSLS